MEKMDHVDGALCTCIRTAYAGEIPDFTHTTVEQVDEWIGSDTYHKNIELSIDEMILIVNQSHNL